MRHTENVAYFTCSVRHTHVKPYLILTYRINSLNFHQSRHVHSPEEFHHADHGIHVFQRLLSPTQQVRRSLGTNNIRTVVARACVLVLVIGALLFGPMHWSLVETRAYCRWALPLTSDRCLTESMVDVGKTLGRGAQQVSPREATHSNEHRTNDVRQTKFQIRICFHDFHEACIAG